MGMRFLLGIRGRRMRLVNFHGVARSTFFLLVGGMLGGRTWLFSTVMWSMEICGIGLCRCRRFGIVGILATKCLRRIFKTLMRTIGLRCMEPMRFCRRRLWIFERRLSFAFVSTVGFRFGGFLLWDCFYSSHGLGRLCRPEETGREERKLALSH